MKTMNEVKKAAIMAVVGFVVACGAETVAAILFIPAFSAEWNVSGEEGYRIDLRNFDENELHHEGTLTGEERHDDFDDPRNGNPLTGSYDGLEIEFTIQRTAGSAQYRGQMTPISDENHTITRIELQSSEGTIILGDD